MGTAGIVPGWYADPMVPGHLRYWDGGGWTEHSAAPLPSVIAHPPTSYFATANLASTPPWQPATPRAPRRRLPLPALFVLGTALIGFPLAIGIGVLAARASAPPPLGTPAAVETPTPTDVSATDDPAATIDATAIAQAEDAAAQRDVTAIAEAIGDFYSTPDRTSSAPPTVVFGGNTYLLILRPEIGGTPDWSWPDIVASSGVRNAGVYGYSSDTWCAWVYIGEDPGRIWKATKEGISAGDCVTK